MKNYTEAELTQILTSAESWSPSVGDESVNGTNLTGVIFGLDAACEMVIEYVSVNIKLTNGETVHAFLDENSTSDEIAVIFEIADQIFRRSGSFDSYDTPVWDTMYEAERKTRIVEQTTYVRKVPTPCAVAAAAAKEEKMLQQLKGLEDCNR